METEKDKVAISELTVIIDRLTRIRDEAEKLIGRQRPILSASEIELIKDHLDLVKKYAAL